MIYFFKFSFGIKLVFLGLRIFSNVNVLHKGLLLQDWVYRLGTLDFSLIRDTKRKRKNAIANAI